MTLQDHIVAGMHKAAESRLARLVELSAPECMLASIRKALEKSFAVKIKNGDPKDLLQREFQSITSGTGRGGKTYYVYQTSQGPVAFFPQGRFGPFVTISK